MDTCSLDASSLCPCQYSQVLKSFCPLFLCHFPSTAPWDLIKPNAEIPQVLSLFLTLMLELCKGWKRKIYDFVSYKSRGFYFLFYNLGGFQHLPKYSKLPCISLIKELWEPAVLPYDCGAEWVPHPFWNSACWALVCRHCKSSSWKEPF